MDPNATKTNSTVKSAIGLLVIVLAIIAVIVFFAMNPALLSNILYVILAIVGVIIVIAIVIAVIMAISAVPIYAKKGETYQTDMSYNVDDVKAVDGKNLEDEKK